MSAGQVTLSPGIGGGAGVGYVGNWPVYSTTSTSTTVNYYPVNI